jgi:crossover junction endodeoxyribonuclease RusA
VIRLTLPLPPTANTYWRHVGKRVLLSKEARRYRDACRLAAVAQYGGELIEDRVRVRADVYMDLRGDLANREKQLLDALEGAVIADDKQVWDLRLVRHLDRESPRVEVEISPIQESP